MFTAKNSNREKTYIPGKKGAVARLIVMGLFVVIAALSCGSFLLSADGNFIDVLLETLVSFGTICMVGAWFWGMMKWIAFIAPKSFGAANNIWCSWSALTIFGLYLKCVVWLVCAIAPISAFMMTFFPMYKMVFSIALNGINFFNAMGMLLLGCILVLVLGFVDVCKLRCCSPVAEVKHFIASRKAA